MALGFPERIWDNYGDQMKRAEANRQAARMSAWLRNSGWNRHDRPMSSLCRESQDEFMDIQKCLAAASDAYKATISQGDLSNIDWDLRCYREYLKLTQHGMTMKRRQEAVT